MVSIRRSLAIRFCQKQAVYSVFCVVPTRSDAMRCGAVKSGAGGCDGIVERLVLALLCFCAGSVVVPGLHLVISLTKFV